MSRALRIAMLAACPFPAPRGTPARIRRLAEALTLRGHDVQVLAYHHGAGEVLPYPVHRIPDVRHYRRMSAGPSLTKLLLLDPLLALSLRRFLARHPVDLVHAHHYEGLLAAATARPSVPVIYDAHTTLAAELPSHLKLVPPAAARWLGRSLDHWLPRLADHTVAVSPTVRDTLLASGAVRPDRISVVGNGIDAAFLHGPPDPAARRPGSGTIVYTGNMGAHQGIDLLLRAFARIRGRRPEARLLLVSHEPFTPYDLLARELGVREATDLRQVEPGEVPALLAAGDVAVSPRIDCPGVPQKLLNYMAAGRPIVAFEGSAGEIRHGQTGLRVRNGDVDALAGAVTALLDEPALAARLGQGAQEQVVSRQTWEIRAEQLERVYAGVIARAAGDRAGIGVPESPGGPSSPSQCSIVAGRSQTS